MKNLKHRKFKTGAIREDKAHKSRPDLISPYFQERLGFVLAKGALIYGERNWEKGIPDESFLASLERHLVAYKQSINKGYSKANVEEDHLAALAYNCMGLIHNEEIKKIQSKK